MATTTLTTSLITTSTLGVESDYGADHNDFIYFGGHGKAIMIGLAATVAILFFVLVCMACCWPKEKKKNDRGRYVTTTYWNGAGNKERCC
ncbi:uncharacterized protein ALTATR162_LOCUS5540 [Alternaria atra]|jgi:hypothetical protein|uniref:Uncharacterized protein n=1 Tax=Alternaria atra TaxID=119953 RepID=A0A8J2I0A8_9PLEO|nr:uncharacterized protein ALTATR162_LOCUS5540 [Alternaria atra]CAG5159351.1 unnamed protein product [Alternaria atra]